MAAPNRFAALSASLSRELEAIPLDASGGRLARLQWLYSQLENYVDRWLAFAGIETIRMKSLLADDLFTMIVVALEIYTIESERDPSAPGRVAWEGFKNAILRVCKTKDRAHLADIRSRLTELGLALHKGS